MTISKRLILMLATALAALILVGSIGVWRLAEAQRRFEYIQANILPSVKELANIKYDTSVFGRLNLRYLLSDDSAKANVQKESDDADKALDKHLATYERDDISDDTDRQLLTDEKANLVSYRAAVAAFKGRFQTEVQQEGLVFRALSLAG